MFSCSFVWWLELLKTAAIYVCRYSRRSWHKITAQVEIPLELDLQPYCHHRPEEVTAYTQLDFIYDLSSVIVHHGSGFSCGHYTTYCWNSEAGVLAETGQMTKIHLAWSVVLSHVLEPPLSPPRWRLLRSTWRSWGLIVICWMTCIETQRIRSEQTLVMQFRSIYLKAFECCLSVKSTDLGGGW